VAVQIALFCALQADQTEGAIPVQNGGSRSSLVARLD
jgi:hypothetical protein